MDQDQLEKDQLVLNKIAILITVANQADKVLSEVGMELITNYIESTGRTAR